jgi:hypothetical protein
MRAAITVVEFSYLYSPASTASKHKHYFCRGLAHALPESAGASHSRFWFVTTAQAFSQQTTVASEAPAALNEHQPSLRHQEQNNDDNAPAECPSDVASSRKGPLPAGHLDFSKRQLLMVFTCAKCEVRAAKAFSHVAYTSGVVLVQCPGCGGRHLIADHLGWFGSKGNIEDFAKEKGHAVVRHAADGTLELTPEDVMGPAATKAAEELAASLEKEGTLDEELR